MLVIKRSVGATAAASAVFIAMSPVLPAAAAAPPSCVKVKVSDYKRYDRVKVTNTSDKGYNIKIVWAHETDSACEWVPGGAVEGTMTSERNWPARYDGLKKC